MSAYKTLTIDSGSAFVDSITVNDEYGEPINLTNYRIKSSIKKSYMSTTSYEFDIFLVNNSQIDLYMPADRCVSIKPGRYVYDVIIIDSTQSIQRVQEGIVEFTAGVTTI